MMKQQREFDGELASLLRSVRLAANWTQDELADKAGISPMSVSAAENGRNTRWDTLTEIAHAFGFDSFIEMCRANGCPVQAEQTRALLRAWKALPDDKARGNALKRVAATVVKPSK